MSTKRVIVLSGGVGGAKLVLGLSHVLPAERLFVMTNTADDFDHFGLRICPDTDTVLYTLSDLADKERGWGRAQESWNFMDSMCALGGADWFNLGDRDLALHVMRTDLLTKGKTLSEVTSQVADALEIQVSVVPMCDQPVATMVYTKAGKLPFQHYFVREQCTPEVTGFAFEGIDKARPNPMLMSALEDRPAAIILAPSNPYVSVAPILEVPGMRSALRACGSPIIAVSPIVGGQALKGPAAKMMQELGVPATAAQIARHYAGFIDGLVIDEKDAHHAVEIADLGIAVEVTQTVMTDLDDRIELAGRTVGFADRLQEEVQR